MPGLGAAQREEPRRAGPAANGDEQPGDHREEDLGDDQDGQPLGVRPARGGGAGDEAGHHGGGHGQAEATADAERELAAGDPGAMTERDGGGRGCRAHAALRSSRGEFRGT
jgi:hypothetical protein